MPTTDNNFKHQLIHAIKHLLLENFDIFVYSQLNINTENLKCAVESHPLITESAMFSSVFQTSIVFFHLKCTEFYQFSLQIQFDRQNLMIPDDNLFKNIILHYFRRKTN